MFIASAFLARRILLACSVLLASPLLAGQEAPASDAAITIETDKPGITISPTLYGIFFEDINRAGDGGLYAEMIQNRSFEDHSTPMAWTLVKSANADAAIALDKTHPLNANNPTCLRLEIKNAGGGRVGIANDGFKGATKRAFKKAAPGEQDERLAIFEKGAKESRSGIAVEKGKQYDFSVYAQGAGNFAGPLTIALEKQDGSVIASQAIKKIGSQLKKFEGSLIANATDSNARLVISATTPATVFLDMVSLFPKETFKGRPNGMRSDLAQMLVNMHPAFIRFPGGCVVEGNKMSEAYRWKLTIGDIAQRPGQWNLWGYRSTDGLGYHECLQFCEDIGAEPLFVINVGMAHKDNVPMDKMDEYVQDALDAIEYANGPADSKWGALRAKAGHPEPFHLKYMEIGNENGGPVYRERYTLFHDAIKKRYPQMQLIACWCGRPTDRSPDILDEHHYNTPEFFAKAATRYDSYDRNGPKSYIGEFSMTKGPGAGKLLGALAEAAFMTGMERNGDLVVMSSYAPLFELAGWATWHPNAIAFDSSRAYGIPSYYAQAMFAANRADVNLPLKSSVSTLLAVAGRKNDTGEIIVKVVNMAEQPQPATLNLKGANQLSPEARMIVMASADPSAGNSFEQPENVVPKKSILNGVAPTFQHTFPANSITVLRLNSP